MERSKSPRKTFTLQTAILLLLLLPSGWTRLRSRQHGMFAHVSGRRHYCDTLSANNNASVGLQTRVALVEVAFDSQPST